MQTASGSIQNHFNPPQETSSQDRLPRAFVAELSASGAKLPWAEDNRIRGRRDEFHLF